MPGRKPVRRSSQALAQLPPYPFAELERKASRWRRGEERALNFSMGDPDLPPPSSVVEAAQREIASAEGHRYPSTLGDGALREAIARWMQVRFGVRVDPATEVAVLLGTKEGIGALPRALLDPGDGILVPDPGYPPYGRGAILAHCRPLTFPLDASREFLPDWDKVPSGGKLMFLNYPNNPTGATATLEQLRPALDRAQDEGLWVASDNAYSEVTFDGHRASSFLELPDAKEHAIEFHSFSKTFGMAGWRLGFVAGNAEAIASLVKFKGQTDSGAARPLQRAAVHALGLYRGPERPPPVDAIVQEYGRRIARLARGLGEAGYDVRPPRGSLYLWQRAPRDDGEGFADWLLQEHGILVTPGGAFGELGRPYVRWSVTIPATQLEEALRRLARAPQPPR